MSAPLAGRLFLATDIPQFVEAVYALLRDVVFCDFVSVLYRSSGTAMLRERDSRGRTYSPAFMRRYGELTPAAKLAVANRGVTILPSSLGLPTNNAELKRMAFYREVMVPQGWRHAVALCFWEQPVTDFPIFVLTLNRREDRDDFDVRDVSRLEALYSLLHAAVGRLLERSATQSILGGLAAAIHRLTQGLIVMNSHRQVIMANAAARRLCGEWVARSSPKNSQPEFLDLPPGVLEACDSLELAWRKRLPAHGRTRALTREIRQPGVSGDILASLRIEDRVWLGPRQPLFFLELSLAASEPSQTPTPLDDVLTAAEREVVMALAEGLSNQEIAERLNKSIHAVKFLLHRVYQKTGFANRTKVVVRANAAKADC